MKKEILVLSLLAAGLIGLPLFAAAAGCCGDDMAAMANCSLGAGQASNSAAPNSVSQLPQPVAAVFDGYIRIQAALAKDSVEGVSQSAQAIVKAINDDAMTTFSTNVVQQATTIAKAADLAGARETFKLLSQALIEYMSKYPALAGSYKRVHCSMVEADWLQTESVVNNPYLGKSMLHCGQFVGSSRNGQVDHSMHMH